MNDQSTKKEKNIKLSCTEISFVIYFNGRIQDCHGKGGGGGATDVSQNIKFAPFVYIKSHVWGREEFLWVAAPDANF